MKLSGLKILTLTILVCGLISCSQFIGYYAKTYSGKPLSRDSVAILSGVVFPYPDDENKSWGERNSNMTMIQRVDGKVIKRLELVELLPGIHNVCVYYIAPAHEKSIGCSDISFKAEPGHMYIAEPVIGNTMDAYGRAQNTWHPIIKDITNEQSLRKQKIEKYIAKNKHKIKDF